MDFVTLRGIENKFLVVSMLHNHLPFRVNCPTWTGTGIDNVTSVLESGVDLMIRGNIFECIGGDGSNLFSIEVLA